MKHPHAQGTVLKRCFGLTESITITVGTVIGVGLFTVGGNVTGMLGPHVFWATLAALAVSIYPAMLYAEMGAALPFAGGTYQYAALGLGRAWGVLAGWNFLISMVSVASGEALAFSFYFRTLCQALGFSLPLNDTALACLAVLAFLLLGIRGVEMTGRMQNGFLFFFWGTALVWIWTMLPSLHFVSFSNAGQGGMTFLSCVAMTWWCFAGFETCCAMGEEIRFPQKNLPRALLLAPFLVFAVNGFFQWALLCMTPAGGLNAIANAAAPYAQGMKQAGMIGLPLVLLCAGIAFGGDFSTLNASVTAPARYLFTMARDGAVPAAFARIHKQYRTPWAASLALGGLTLLLVATGSIQYIASLSLFATLFYYVIGIAAAWGLRHKQPHLTRPFRAPLLKLGAPVSICLYLLLMTQLDRWAIVSGLAWSLLGLAVCRPWRNAAKPHLSQQTAPSPPEETQRRRMDQEYRIWKTAVAAAVLLVIGLYLLAYLYR